MMYAATKATVRKAFQSGVIVDDVAATSKVLLLIGSKCVTALPIFLDMSYSLNLSMYIFACTARSSSDRL